MSRIPLTQEKFALVSARDIERVMKYKWYFIKPRVGLDEKNMGYAARKVGTKRQFLHQFILKPKKGFVTDHINKDGLDNRRENLRLVTHAVNMENSRPRSSTGYKGVYWSKTRKRFRAQICLNGKLISLGDFKTSRAAADAWNDFAKKHRVGAVFFN